MTIMMLLIIIITITMMMIIIMVLTKVTSVASPLAVIAPMGPLGRPASNNTAHAFFEKIIYYKILYQEFKLKSMKKTEYLKNITK